MTECRTFELGSIGNLNLSVHVGNLCPSLLFKNSSTEVGIYGFVGEEKNEELKKIASALENAEPFSIDPGDCYHIDLHLFKGESEQDLKFTLSFEYFDDGWGGKLETNTNVEEVKACGRTIRGLLPEILEICRVQRRQKELDDKKYRINQTRQELAKLEAELEASNS